MHPKNLADIRNVEETVFDSFTAFKAQFDIPEAHWAIDVYTPPDAEYRKVHDWACQLHTRGYSLGKISDYARLMFRRAFLGHDRDENNFAVFIVPTGTAANSLARMAVLDQNKSIILCSEMSHQTDREAGSVESLTGSRALKPSDIFSSEEIGDNKYMDMSRLKAALERREDKYLNQRPWMISLSFPAEDGSIPSKTYVKSVADFARENNLLFHLDGARLLVAAAALGKSLKELTVDAGVDIVSFGGSKVGMIGIDSVIFTPHFFAKYPHLHHYAGAKECFDHFRSVMKRIGALSGRSEEGAAQFARALTDDYGINIGRKAWQNAKRLEKRLQDINGVALAMPVETNVVCVRMSREGYEGILKARYPYIKVFKKDADGYVVRFMPSHCTTDQHVDEACVTLSEIGEKCPL